MVELRPFRALRPRPDRAEEVASPPYDVVDVAEARALAAGRPDSFLHVTRPEIDLPDGAPAAAVHRAGRAALDAMIARGVLVPDARPTFSVYRQRRGTAVQTGVVGLASVAEYRCGVVAVHERTRPDKEDDRTEHLGALSAHDEPVFLMYPGRAPLDALVAGVAAGPPQVRLTDHEGVEHTLWVVTDPDVVAGLAAAFSAVPVLYVADGHHRSAAAARLAARSPHRAGVGGFPAVAFPAEQLTVLPYHRVIASPLSIGLPELLAALADRFTVETLPAGPGPGGPGDLGRHQFGLYSGRGRWYRITARPGTVAGDDPAGDDPVARLDVAVLQDAVLGPLLGIADPRSDPRLAFVGGSRGTAELERLVDAGGHALAVALCATSAAEVMAVADRKLLMPPKSTWFDPKPASGLFVHPLGVDQPGVDQPGVDQPGVDQLDGPDGTAQL